MAGLVGRARDREEASGAICSGIGGAREGGCLKVAVMDGIDEG